MYKQVTTPNWNIPYKGGWCLKYVNDAFDSPLRQPNATSSYNREKRNGNVHVELPPIGLYTPVYFSLSNQPLGHVAIALPDGTIASSTLDGTHPKPYIHKNIYDIVRVYSNGRTCTYLGWSEWIDGTHVAQFEDEVLSGRFPFKTTLKRGTTLYTLGGVKYSSPTVKDRTVVVLDEFGDKYRVYCSTFNPNIVYVQKNVVDGSRYPYSATIKKGSILYNEFGLKYRNPSLTDRIVTVLGEVNGRLKIEGKSFIPNVVYCDKESIK